MGKLFKLLKPYGWSVLIIMVLHVVQAYTMLLLPDYTSNLIDVGIQNGGFEYTAPIAMTKEEAQQFEQLLLPEELTQFQANYTTTSAGNYELNSSVQADGQLMTQLGQTFREPLAIMQAMSTMSAEQQQAIQQAGAVATASGKTVAEVVRPRAQAELEPLGDNVVKNMAKQVVKSMYTAAGYDATHYQMSYLFKAGFMMLVVAFVSVASAFGAHYFAARIGADIGHTLRMQTFEKVLAFSQTEINKFSTSSLITRTTNDIQQIQVTMTMLLRIVLFAPVMALGGIIHVLTTKASMVWIVGLGVAVVMSVVAILVGITMPKFKMLQKQIDQVNLYAREILTGLQVVRAYGRQEVEAERFDGASVELRDTNLFTNRVMSLMMPSMMILMNVISIFIIWVAGRQIADGQMQVGEMTAFINYTMQIIFSFLMLTMMSVQLPRAVVSAERIDEVVAEPLRIQDKEAAVHLSEPKGVVEFKHVDFRYAGADADTLQDITFTARPGKTTAIIGSTGSGKSTVLSLLMRFYDVTRGQITMDGVDIRDLSQAQLRDLMGYVPQKGILFSGTIESNIGYGRNDLSQADLEQAAEIAHATEFIAAKEDGYQSAIAQGGGNVSGGQKQRLSIARAVAKQPKVFLFDDSFSALDYRTDASLRKALAEKTADATVMIVAQRVSTILEADEIVVLDEGRIAGIGTHAQLMRESSVYREIATSQLSEAELARYSEPKMEGGN